MSRYSVLIDSSVWIEYFKTGGLPILDRIIEEDLVCINEIFFTELAPLLKKREKQMYYGDWEQLKGFRLK